MRASLTAARDSGPPFYLKEQSLLDAICKHSFLEEDELKNVKNVFNSLK